MKEHNYNDQMLQEYLLGALPTTETESLDELDFTDEEFSARLKSIENNLIDAYLQDELFGQTLEKFKARYLNSPRRNKKVEIARAFQKSVGRGLQADNEALTVAASASDRNKSSFFSGLTIFSTRNPAFRWGFAALALILMAAVGSWLISPNSGTRNDLQAKTEAPSLNPPSAVPSQNQNLPAEKETANLNAVKTTNINAVNIQPIQSPKPAPLSKPSPEIFAPKQAHPPLASQAFFILALPLRGSREIQTIAIPLQTTEVAMQLELEFNKYPYYKVRLVSQAGDKSFWSIGKLKATSNGQSNTLNIRFPANLLKSQIYLLEVSGITSTDEAEIISNYPFRAVLR